MRNKLILISGIVFLYLLSCSNKTEEIKNLTDCKNTQELLIVSDTIPKVKLDFSQTKDSIYKNIERNFGRAICSENVFFQIKSRKEFITANLFQNCKKSLAHSSFNTINLSNKDEVLVNESFYNSIDSIPNWFPKYYENNLNIHSSKFSLEWEDDIKLETIEKTISYLKNGYLEFIEDYVKRHFPVSLCDLNENELSKIKEQFPFYIRFEDLASFKKKTLQDYKLSEDKNKSYKTVKIEIRKERTSLKNQNLDSISNQFQKVLLNRIFPFWEGTPWSFEGHTSVPNEGEIACGYFVSTTLRDLGLNLNRYKLAQLSPENESKNLAIETKVIEIEADDTQSKIDKIQKALPVGIHFIGFDTGHVGFILKENESQLFLIHSNYLDGNGVGIENVWDSEVFDAFSKFYFVELSSNEKLLQYWVEGKEILIDKM
ncbi:hypothetical protein [Aureivirga sp. CE67]|uniref:hypothetical protein n=1 Tax=Aureivirga sp. CE67 TaxID=1788983 RepID=UPI0018C99355|nr:hypothetical protein [Aureivirga sp. CE67]